MRLHSPILRFLALIFIPLVVDGAAAAPAEKRPNVQMPDEYVPSSKQNSLPAKSSRVGHEGPAHGTVHPVRHHDFLLPTQDSFRLFRYPNLHEVRLIPTKKDIAFVEYLDKASSTVAKDALHNYKLDGESKIKVRLDIFFHVRADF